MRTPADPWKRIAELEAEVVGEVDRRNEETLLLRQRIEDLEEKLKVARGLLRAARWWCEGCQSPRDISLCHHCGVSFDKHAARSGHHFAPKRCDCGHVEESDQ